VLDALSADHLFAHQYHQHWIKTYLAILIRGTGDIQKISR